MNEVKEIELLNFPSTPLKQFKFISLNWRWGYHIVSFLLHVWCICEFYMFVCLQVCMFHVCRIRMHIHLRMHACVQVPMPVCAHVCEH